MDSGIEDICSFVNDVGVSEEWVCDWVSEKKNEWFLPVKSKVVSCKYNTKSWNFFNTPFLWDMLATGRAITYSEDMIVINGNSSPSIVYENFPA